MPSSAPPRLTLSPVAREQTLPADSWWGQTPDASSVTGPPRPADEIVKEIETQLKIAHGPQAQTNFVAFHAQVADLVSELRSAYPDDPRVTLYLPERWESLTFLNRRADIFGEIKRVVLAAKDPELKKEALLFEACLKNLEPINGRTSASIAASFDRQAPGDSRTGELLRLAVAKLDEDWYPGGLFLIFAVSGMLTALSTWMHRGQAMGGLKIALYVGALAIGVVPLLLIAFQFLACERQNAIYGGILGWLNLFGEPELQRRATVAAFTLLHKSPATRRPVLERTDCADTGAGLRDRGRPGDCAPAVCERG